MIALDMVRVGLLAVLVATTSLVLVQIARTTPPTVVVVHAAASAPAVVSVPMCGYWYSGTRWSLDVNPYCGPWRD